MYITSRNEQRIRMEAASQAINKFIREVEEGLNIVVPSGGTPSERRTETVRILRQRIQGR